jgi:hypothetical protein
MAIFAGTPTPFGSAINAGQDHVYSGARHLPQGINPEQLRRLAAPSRDSPMKPLNNADECGVHCQTHPYDGEDPIRRA